MVNIKKLPAYLINLEHRTDRLESATKCLNEIGIKFKRFNAIKHEKGGVYGCFASHIAVWKQFLEEDKESDYVLVFEDDIRIRDKNIKWIEKINEFLSTTKESVDVLFLHNIRMYERGSVRNKDFYNAIIARTHAMCVSRKYIERIFSNGIPEPDGIHFDIAFGSRDSEICTFDTWALGGPMFEQNWSETDNYKMPIVDHVLDVMCRYPEIGLFVPRLITKTMGIVNEDKALDGWNIASRAFKKR